MNKKAFEGEWIMRLMQILLICLMIALIVYVLLVSMPYETKCKKLCNNNKPDVESLIDFDVPIFDNICICYYSNSIKSFKIK